MLEGFRVAEIHLTGVWCGSAMSGLCGGGHTTIKYSLQVLYLRGGPRNAVYPFDLQAKQIHGLNTLVNDHWNWGSIPPKQLVKVHAEHGVDRRGRAIVCHPCRLPSSRWTRGPSRILGLRIGILRHGRVLGSARELGRLSLGCKCLGLLRRREARTVVLVGGLRAGLWQR